MGINSLEESKSDPHGNCEQVQVSSQHNPGDGDTNGANSEKSNFNRVGVLCSEAKGSSVSVVLLVDVLVEGSVVQASVEPVVPGILKNKKQGQVSTNLQPGGERNADFDSGVFANGVEAPDGDGLDQEVGHEHRLHAVPLLSKGGDLGLLDLVLSEVGDLIKDSPRHTSAKVENLVEQEDENATGDQIIAKPHEVGSPNPLHDVKGVAVSIRELSVCAQIGRSRRQGRVDVLQNRRHGFLRVFWRFSPWDGRAI